MQKAFWLFILLFGLFSIVSAGTTGKLAGRVVDKQSGEPLIGANILIKDTQFGAATDLDGYYSILNLPPGNYVLQAIYIGYQTIEITNVTVSVDLTTNIDFELGEETLEVADVITVVAERPVIKKDLTATTSVVNDQEIQALPVTEISEILELQAGYVDGHMRGGRSGEVAYWIDGIPVTDAYDGGQVVEVSKDMVQELQVVSGAFNAEYGNAMSGIVNIATKEGSNNASGQFTTYFGDHISSHDKIFWNVSDFNPFEIYNFDGSINGPIIRDKLYYFINARHVYFDGWLDGRRDFNPSAVSGLVQLGEDEDPFWYVLGSDAGIDQVIAQVYGGGDSTETNRIYNHLRENYSDGKGDGKYVPMNWSQKTYGQAKLIYRFTDLIKLMANSIYETVDYRDFNRDYKLNPDGDLVRNRTGFTQLVKLSHALSTKTFYDLGLTYFYKKYEEFTYEDPFDSRYVHPDAAIQRFDQWSFNTGGTNLHRFKRETGTYGVKFDITSQINRQNQLKAGLELKSHRMTFREIDLRPIALQSTFDPFVDSPFITTRILDDTTINAASYVRYPQEASFYLQNKVELEDIILNFGVRFDYFDADGQVLSDPTEPNILQPLKPENQYHDLNNNGQRDPGEPEVSVAEREKYWYKNVKAKYQFSPRVGIAFPISARGKIYFSYGHFFQRPRFELLYSNPDYDIEIGELPLFGNADLKPEKTVSGELGIQQQISDDLSVDATVYFRDVRDLTGTRLDLVTTFNGEQYAIYQNSDFGLIKGFIIALNKRYSGGISARLDYTYQIAEGTASDPADARNARAGGQEVQVAFVPLNWDQRHTVNGSFSYNSEDWGFSLIGQYGSGLPYTPSRLNASFATILTNGNSKPSSFNLDLKAYKDFFISDYRVTAFLRVYNLLDVLNEVNVYNDTGTADQTYEYETNRDRDRTGSYNTIEEWFTNATHYNEPRRVELGFTFNF